MGPTATWLTLEHEKVHAILADAGIILPKRFAEDVCNANRRGQDSRNGVAEVPFKVVP